jgi:hypothetical protein
MKSWIFSLSVLAAAASPSNAHHQQPFGIFWKGIAPDKGAQARIAARDIWRYAFVSKYQWNADGYSLWNHP